MKNYLESKFKNKKVLILGFAREGKSTYNLLRKYFPDMIIGVADQNVLTEGFDNKTVTYFGKDYLDHLSDFDVVVKSPGVSGLNKKILKAQKGGVEITSQTKIFFDIALGTVIGVTGTKGKSTTVSLIYEILKNANFNVSLVGNIGNPVLDSLESDSKDKYYVFELSSHQLFDLTKSPHIAVVTNVSVDHLDWYGNFENYVDAKANILKYQNDGDTAILNYDNLISREFDRFTKGNVLFTSKSSEQSAFVKNGNFILNLNGKTEVLGKTSELTLIGKHNWDNVMEAALTAKVLGIDNKIIWKTVTSFKQLEHHLEFVKEVNGIKFYNDSFAVDQIATIAAINSFDVDLTLILGGYDRGIDYTELAIEISKKKNIKNIIIIGQIAEKLNDILKKHKFNGNIIKLGHTSMIRIIEEIQKVAQPNEVVLFSPAAASFDMFKDYKDRGVKFKDCVNEL